ncbi:MAG TPA: adenylosuccinate lyase [Steroidobacteraceae bacterium]|jgi:adenylosuccinate lyase|nr:adenylosuccinate lyase [Steroidobacteraceae bacterium]
MDVSSLNALSPVDGRYRAGTRALAALLSEAALIKERIRVEALWIGHLAARVPSLLQAPLSAGASDCIARLTADPGDDAASQVKTIEARINHDVKAVEYFVRECLAAVGASPAVLELVHFGCTSEDINNLSYARLLQRTRQEVLLPQLDALIRELAAAATRHAALAMLSRTHGQAATPTTLGKEFANIAARLKRARARLAAVTILGKWNGAVGNLNAQVVAVPDADWLAISESFVTLCGVSWNPYTTQIEPHDWVAEYCDAVAAINVIGIDMCRDIWGYVSLGYLRQRPVAGEVGSSTMPHKINPIDFENAEGNLGLANALLRHFAEKLPVSRWQRDLTDSTVLRNVGVALGHTLLAWRAALRGMGKIDADPVRIAQDLDNAWEVLGEAVQTVLRAAGVPNGYEMLKDFTRGRPMDRELLAGFIASLPLPAAERDRLTRLTPSGYIGVATTLAQRGGI